MLVARLYKTKRTPKRRKAIEIRLVDIQECPDADIAEDEGGDQSGGGNSVTLGDIWKHIFGVLKNDLTAVSRRTMERMLERCTLATVLYKKLGRTPCHQQFICEYKKLAELLTQSTLWSLIGVTSTIRKSKGKSIVMITCEHVCNYTPTSAFSSTQGALPRSRMLKVFVSEFNTKPLSKSAFQLSLSRGFRWAYHLFASGVRPTLPGH